MIDVGVVTALVPVIAKILSEAGKALRLLDIEFKVKDLEITIRVKDKERVARADTFDVRDAVNELVATGKAEFDQPGYKVRLKHPEEGVARPATAASSRSRPTRRKSTS